MYAIPTVAIKVSNLIFTVDQIQLQVLSCLNGIVPIKFNVISAIKCIILVQTNNVMNKVFETIEALYVTMLSVILIWT